MVSTARGSIPAPPVAAHCLDQRGQNRSPAPASTGLGALIKDEAYDGSQPEYSQCQASGLPPPGSAQAGWKNPNRPELAFIQLNASEP